MAIRVEPGRKVRIVYRILDSEGRLLEERTPENPYEYEQGTGQIVLPVERALSGKTAGFKTEIQVSPREGYGDYDSALVTEMPRSGFPNSERLQVGMKFNTRGPNGQVMTVRVIEVEDESVTIDGNHPLAGLELLFEVRILEVLEGESEPSSSGGRGGRTVH